MIIYLILALITAGGVTGGFYLLFKSSTKNMSKKSNEILYKLLSQVTEAQTKIDSLLLSKDSFVGKNQYSFLTGKFDEISSQISAEKKALEETEQKLDTAQKLVETKESQQQEIKTAKEEDLIKLQEISAAFEETSQESINLEQQLASSLRSLDALVAESQMNQVQKESVTFLQQAVETAGARMRDLLTEYQTVNERLTMLQQQHADLEEEYTRLVEQQLGE